MKLNNPSLLPASLSARIRRGGPAIFLSAALTLALVVACGPGADSQTATSSGAAAPTAIASDSQALPASADSSETMVESNPQTTESPASPPEPSAEVSGADQPAATPAVEEASPTVADNVPDAMPPPTATPSVGQLAALVEANPAADTPEPEPVQESTQETAPEPTAEPERQIAEGPLAAEPAGIYAWINSDPLTLEQLRGKVVLVDFWTYTCVNCIRTFPYLKLWHSRYADDGLVILGIHTPEFEFEKNYWNVLEATEENGIAWPVAQDNDFETWQAYSNRFWPAKYLIDRDGVIRYTHFGEGKYGETEEEIRKLLLEAGADLSDDAELPEDQQLDPAYLGALDAEVTPELYAGYERNVNSILSGFHPYVAQATFYENRGGVGNFVAPDELDPHLIFFHGPWAVGPENIKHARVSHNYEDYLALKYSAKSVNAVLTSDSGEPYRVRVTLDGQYLTEDNKGSDVQIGEDGESYLQVDQPRLYAIIDSPQYTQRQELKLSSNSPDFGLFAFTFGVYQGKGP